MSAQKTFLFVCGAFACCRLVLAEPKPTLTPEERSIKDAVLKADSVTSLKDSVAKADNIFIGEVLSAGGLVPAGNNQVRPGDSQVKVVRVLHGSGPTQSLVTCWSDRMWLSLPMDSHHEYLMFARKPVRLFPILTTICSTSLLPTIPISRKWRGCLVEGWADCGRNSFPVSTGAAWTASALCARLAVSWTR
jgi:hypothetical protein